ncbi:MAG: hypothetical protein K6G06_03245 [Butyrivibrio sp.]|nr:hypothetical protein [Butyrivibrio sp.]
MLKDLQEALFSLNKKCDDNNEALLYRLFAYETCKKSGDEDICLSEDAQKDKETIEELFDNQTEDGDLVGISVPHFVSVMCVSSRVFEDVDPVFSRECMHAALESGLGLLESDATKEDAEGLLLAFSELLKTDYEIRNTYDHSLMAGMPQKMSRQKKYKMSLSKNFDIAFTCDDSAKEYELSDVHILAIISILTDVEENISGNFRNKLENYLFEVCDQIVAGDARVSAIDGTTRRVLVDVAVLSLESKLEKQNSEDNDNSQLIKVIEYNVMQSKPKKLSDEEIDIIKQRIENYKSKN